MSDVCEACGGEPVEGPLVCGDTKRGGCADGMCGGCYEEIPCPDCSEEGQEPDWDVIAENAAENRALRAQDEVEWESKE